MDLRGPSENDGPRTEYIGSPAADPEWSPAGDRLPPGLYDLAMSRPGADYHVARSTGVCAASGKELTPGSPCVATLCERVEDDGFDRLDYSPQVWAEGARPQRLFSFWKTIVPDPGDRRPTFVDDDVLMDLFEQMAGDERRTRVAYRFVLALILMRKRRLKYVTRRGVGEVERWLVQPKGADPEATPIEVVNPKLTDEDVRQLTGQLAEVLQGDLQ